MTGLDQMRADWTSVARYTVLRVEAWRGDPAYQRITLHTGKSWAEARQLQADAEAVLKAEPGYQGMRRPLILIELENRDEALAHYRTLQEGRRDEAA